MTDKDFRRLALAVCEGHTGLIPHLRGIDLNSPLLFGSDPEMVARAADDSLISNFNSDLYPMFACTTVSEVKHLVRSGKNLAHVSTGVTPITFASHNGFAEVVAELILAGANPNGPDNDASVRKPLAAAILNEHIEVVRELCAGGADPNCNFLFTSALFAACYRGNIEIVHCLIDHGALVEWGGHNGAIPPLVAAMTKFVDKDLQIALELLRHGAHPESVEGRDLTPIDGAEQLSMLWRRGLHPIQQERRSIGEALTAWRSPSGAFLTDVLVRIVCDFIHL